MDREGEVGKGSFSGEKVLLKPLPKTVGGLSLFWQEADNLALNFSIVSLAALVKVLCGRISNTGPNDKLMCLVASCVEAPTFIGLMKRGFLK